MGGVLIIISILVPTLLLGRFAAPVRLDRPLCAGWHSELSDLIDDYAKVMNKAGTSGSPGEAGSLDCRCWLPP